MSQVISVVGVEQKIFYIRGQKVILDWYLAELYNVPTSRINEQVKRNVKRFPPDFMFQLTPEELRNWMSQIAISNKVRMHLRNRVSQCFLRS